MYLVPNIHPGSGSAGVPTVQANFAGSPADWTTLDSTSSMPTGGSISRAGNAMLYDSTGKLTYAPSNTFVPSAGDTGFSGAGTTPPTVASSQTILGQSSTAITFTSAMTSTGFAGCRAFSSVTAPISTGVTYVGSIFVTLSRALTGSESIVVYWTGAWPSATTTITSANSSSYVGQWVRASVTLPAGATGSVYPVVYLNGVVSTDLIVYVSRGQVEAVTYATTPAPYVATTTSAYYGPRFDYDPVTLQPKGLLVEGQLQQLVSWSEDFRNTADAGTTRPWTYSDVTISPNVSATTAPDGTNTSDKLIEAATTAEHFIQQSVTASNGVYTYSIYLKAAERTNALVVMSDLASGNATVLVNLSAGTITSTTSSGSWSGTTSAILNSGNGWYRVSLTAIKGAGASIGARTYLYTTSSTYAGNGTSGIYVWGAQLEARAFPTSYLPTQGGTSPFATRAAETFSLTGYANRLVEAFYIDEQTGGSFSGNSALSTGTVTINPPTFGWVTSLRAYTNAYAGSISTPSWLSFSRAGNATYYDSTGTLTFAANNLLLNTATLSTQTVTTGIIPTCDVILSFKGTGSVAISGGYTGTLAGTGASDRVFLKFTTTTASLTFTVTGTVTEAQLERVTYQTQPSLYVANTGSQSYGPRYDFDPSTVPATPRGLLIEESRDNLLTYSDNFVNALGWVTLRLNTTGTPPSNNQAVAPDGTTTADYLIDTAVAGTHVAIQAYTKAASAITYAASVYLKAGARTNAEFRCSDQAGNGVRAAVNLTTGVVGAIAAYGTGFTATSSASQNVGNGWWRITLVFTSNTATSLGPEIYVCDSSANISYTGDGVSGIFVWGAQLETGSFATSYIPTTTASVTRAADVAQLTGSALTTLRASAATAIAQTNGFRAATGAYPRIVGASSGATLFYDGILNKCGTLLNSVLLYPANTVTISSAQRFGYAFSSVGRSISVNGQNAATDTTVLQLSSGTFGLGYDNSAGNEYLNGWVASLALYNQRLPDAILKQKSVVNAPY